MATTRDERRLAFVNKVATEVAMLEAAGVVLAGNAFSSVCFLKGELSRQEREGAALLSGADGDALRASLAALGYAPEDWCAAATCLRDGRSLTADTLVRTVVTLDPSTLIICDDAAAAAVRGAYADELSSLPDARQSALEAGWVVPLLGMRAMNLGGFAAALLDQRQKQLMWARLKQLPPLGEPY